MTATGQKRPGKLAQSYTVKCNGEIKVGSDHSTNNILAVVLELTICEFHSLLATECRVFGDNSASEFHGISQTALWNSSKFAAENGGSGNKISYHQYQI